MTKTGTISRYKRTKLGMLPGDIPIQHKAYMREKGIQVALPYYPRPEKTRRSAARGYKRDVNRIANRRARRAPIEDDDEGL